MNNITIIGVVSAAPETIPGRDGRAAVMPVKVNRAPQDDGTMYTDRFVCYFSNERLMRYVLKLEAGDHVRVAGELRPTIRKKLETGMHWDLKIAADEIDELAAYDDEEEDE